MLIFGGSGHGKTYFSSLVIKEHLRRRGSLVVLDPKPETIRRLRGACHEAGLAPERVRVIMGSEPESAPGLNPLLTRGDPAEVVAELLAVFEIPENAPRVGQYLDHALVLAAWHRLSLLDVPRLLFDHAYRADILASTPYHPKDEVYRITEDFFTQRFLTLKEGERDNSITGVETRLRKFMENRLFLRMFGAQENTVDFDSLFKKPGAILVCLEEVGGITEKGTRLLAGLITHFLKAASIRRPGPVPVILAADELRKVGNFLQERMQDIVNMARERNIRLLFAAQHPAQVPGPLLDDLLDAAAVKLYFHPGPKGVSPTAAVLARADRLSPQYEDEEDEEAWEAYDGPLYAFHVGQPKLSPLTASYPPNPRRLFVDPDNPGESLQKFAVFDETALPPLYLQDGTRAADAFRGLPSGMTYLQWRGGTGWAVVEPPPHRHDPTEGLTPQEKWEQCLLALRPGEAVMDLPGSPRTSAQPPGKSRLWMRRAGTSSAPGKHPCRFRSLRPYPRPSQARSWNIRSRKWRCGMTTASNRRKRFVRSPVPDHSLTPLKIEALRHIVSAKFLSTPQVAAMMGLSDRAVRSHLRDLYDMKLLDVLAIPGAAIGSRALIAAKLHVPTKQGLQTLADLDLLPIGSDKAASYRPDQYQFLGHELMVRDTLVWLSRSIREHPGHILEHWDCSAGLSLGGTTADAVFRYRFKSGDSQSTVTALVEADMGTERSISGDSDRWSAKIAGYSAAFRDTAREAIHALTGRHRARLVVTVPSEARAAWIMGRVQGTPVESFTWVAVREELLGADVYTPVWYRAGGMRCSFLERGEKE